MRDDPALPPDPWLERWLPLLIDRAAGMPVLEMGCGRGDDTCTLVAAGLDVVAFDLSPEAVAEAQRRVPQAHITRRNILDPLPVAASGTGAIVASLSLHYFPWDQTQALARRIRDALRPGGVLLCRLNSTEDHHYGARGHPRIAPDYYLVDGAPKRFFDRPAVQDLFAEGWHMASLVHATTGKYGAPKALWEVVVEREG